MAEITAALVKDLRERTGARHDGLQDGADRERRRHRSTRSTGCARRASSAAAKKSGRVAAEGLVGVASVPAKAAMVEVNSETDFVARNDAFQDFVQERRQGARCMSATTSMRSRPRPIRAPAAMSARSWSSCVATIGENMNIRRAACFPVRAGRGRRATSTSR
jgi:elongation factor Ts